MNFKEIINNTKFNKCRLYLDGVQIQFHDISYPYPEVWFIEGDEEYSKEELEMYFEYLENITLKLFDHDNRKCNIKISEYIMMYNDLIIKFELC